MSDLIERGPFKRERGEHDRGAGRIEAVLALSRVGARSYAGGSGSVAKVGCPANVTFAVLQGEVEV